VAVLGKPFDGGDWFSGNLYRGRNAGTKRRSVNENGTSPAPAFAASIFAAGKFQFVTQDPEEHAVGVDLKAIVLLIDDEFHTSILRLLGVGREWH
jgi:hypothetical protein